MTTTSIAAPPSADLLEERLGDPYAPENPYGFTALHAARTAGVPFTAGRELLDSLGLLAGHRADAELLETLRAVTRRAPRLAWDRVPSGTAAEAVRIGAATGALDSGLRIALRHLHARRLYGAPAIDIPQLRAVLAGVFADLLLCDALTSASARGEDLSPTRAGVHAAAVRSFVPRAVQDALDRLSVILGAWFYIRQDERAAFQELLRDTQRALFGAGAVRIGPEPADLVGLLDAPGLAGLCDPVWLAAAPSLRARAALPRQDALRELYEELIRRYRAHRSFGLTCRPLPDRP
ncbi:acyl-CoA dehydrogenase family protein [Streptomyces huasconensis]|uniref:acyl-CoA dehydrogenase family protein n=1 Tax=Streptomyces huasconensis TaxID=1854574 RepID=UPI0033C89035